MNPQVRKIERRFGNHDFDRYEDITSDKASLGTKTLDRVTIDSGFRFKKSQWGVLTEDRHPGGLVSLDLTFNQPSDCRLKEATVKVTLDDDSKELIHQFPVAREAEVPNVPVHILHHGPTLIMGAAKHAHKTIEHNMAPEVSFGELLGIGNMGRRSERSFEQEFRWTFHSHKAPSKKNSSLYKVLTWELTENKLDEQSFRDNTIHTAFAFQHGSRPFLLQVAISGGLRNRWSEVGHRFSSWRDARFATTLVNFNGRERSSQVLDELAESLPYIMARENAPKAPNPMQESQKLRYTDIDVEQGRLDRDTSEVPETSPSIGGYTVPAYKHEETSSGNRRYPSTKSTESMREQSEEEQSISRILPTEDNLANVLSSLSSVSKTQQGPWIHPLYVTQPDSDGNSEIIDKRDKKVADREAERKDSEPFNQATEQENRPKSIMSISRFAVSLRIRPKHLLQSSLQALGLLSVIKVLLSLLLQNRVYRLVQTEDEGTPGH